MKRKQLIAQAALQLFADRGFEATSTALIAKEAQVSEALIFKHFGNKEQLLDYIIRSGYKRIIERGRGRLPENAPLALIHTIIDLPYTLVLEEPAFWKLQNRLVDVPLARTQHERFLQPLPNLLIQAFQQLAYAQPEKEARLLMLLVEVLWKSLTTQDPTDIREMLAFIKTKYQRQT